MTGDATDPTDPKASPIEVPGDSSLAPPQPEGAPGAIDRRRFLGVLGIAGGAAAAGAGTALLVEHAVSGDSTSPSGNASIAPDAYAETAPNEVSLVPVPAGRVEHAVDRIDGLVTGLMEKTKIPGVGIAVVHGGKVAYAKGFGVRRVGVKGTVGTGTVFQLASLSKSVASTVVAAAVSQDIVAWDDTVVSNYPSFAVADPYVTAHATLIDMFSHRSGLPDHAGDLLEDLGYSQNEIISRLVHYPLDPFRASYAYTNFGLTAAALSVAAAKGVSWSQLSEELLYGPARMNSSSSDFAAYQRAPDHADLHVKVDGAWQAKYTRNADAQSPAGGVSASVDDMARWMQLQLGGGTIGGKRIVDEKALLATHIPQFTSSPASNLTARSGFYGLGYNVGYDGAGHLVLSHSGAFALGAGTAFTMLPALGIGIVTLTNAQPIGVAESVNATFADLVVVGEPTRDWYAAFGPRISSILDNPSELAGKPRPANAAPARPDASYTGTYSSDLYGTAAVSSSPDGLMLALGPEPQRFPLAHWDGNVFSYVPSGENAAGITAVTFTVDGNGKATKVNVENLNGNPVISPDLGTFTRT